MKSFPSVFWPLLLLPVGQASPFLSPGGYGLPRRSIQSGKQVSSLDLLGPEGKKVRLGWKGKKWRLLLWAREDTRFHLALADLAKLFLASPCLGKRAELWVIFPGSPRQEEARAVTGFSRGSPSLPFRAAFDPGQKNWDAFGVIATPTLHLVDPGGRLRGEVAGCPQDYLERVALILKKEMDVDTPFPGGSSVGAGEKGPALRFLNMAKNLLEKGMAQAALRVLEKAEKRFPRSLSLGKLLGFLYLGQGAMGRAKGVFTRLARDFPSAPGPKIGLAACRIISGELDGAAEDLEKLEMNHPGIPLIRFYQGMVLEKKGDYRKAMGKYKEAFFMIHPELGRR